MVGVIFLVAGAGRGEAEEPERSDGNRLYGSIADKKAVGSKSITAFYDNKKSRNLLRPRLLYSFGSGGWNRTNGLQVMSLTSYHCSTPQRSVLNIARGWGFVKSNFAF